MRLSKLQLIILSSALECTKNNTLRPLAQKGCALLAFVLLNVFTNKFVQTVCKAKHSSKPKEPPVMGPRTRVEPAYSSRQQLTWMFRIRLVCLYVCNYVCTYYQGFSCKINFPVRQIP